MSVLSSSSFSFDVLAECRETSARVGRLRTPHGTIQTPTFMPVGTGGSVKALTPEDVRRAGAECVLGNTYHLALHPGAQRIARLGGLQRFTGWDGPMLTDSGGFQVFSLADLTEMDERGVTIATHLDGRRRRFTPESVVGLQEQLGADLIMPLDVCLPAGADPAATREAAERTARWAERGRRAQRRADQWLFGIVQGGLYESERREAARAMAELDFPGYAIGGLSVGESPALTSTLTELTVGELPRHKPRYIMGVGTPAQIAAYPGFGIDMFDCVLPTRLGRGGVVFSGWGRINLGRGHLASPREPIDPDCRCTACRGYSRIALRSMFQDRMALAYRLASLHNVTHLARLAATVRQAIVEGWYPRLHREALAAVATPAAGLSHSVPLA